MAIIALFHAEVAVIIPGWWSPSDGLRTSPWNGKELHASTVVWPFYHANGNRNIATQEPFSDQIEPTRAPKTRVFSSICWKSERQKKKKTRSNDYYFPFFMFCVAALDLSLRGGYSSENCWYKAYAPPPTYQRGPLEQLRKPPKSRKWCHSGSGERKRNRRARVGSSSLSPWWWWSVELLPYAGEP